MFTNSSDGSANKVVKKAGTVQTSPLNGEESSLRERCHALHSTVQEVSGLSSHFCCEVRNLQ